MNMGSRLIGYRIRGMNKGKVVYIHPAVDGGGFYWFSESVPEATPLESCRFAKCEALKDPIDENGEPLEVSDVKIVSVYLRTVAKAPIDRTLSDFNREIVAEIDRRKIDAFVEPEDFGAMPTTLRFRTPNGGFVWVPILAFSVVEGPKQERAKRTVDRMLEAIGMLASSLVATKGSGLVDCDGFACRNKAVVDGDPPWFCEMCKQ